MFRRFGVGERTLCGWETDTQEITGNFADESQSFGAITLLKRSEASRNDEGPCREMEKAEEKCQ